MISVLLLSAANVHAQLYKWVDDQGVTHYTKAPPPESAKHDREILGKQGQTKGIIRGLISDEEKRAEAEKRAAEEAKQKAEEDARQRDRNLLISYKAVQEIIDKRDLKLEYINHLIGDLEEDRNDAKVEYDELLQQAIQAEREGKAPSEDLKANLRSAQRQYQQSHADLNKARADREKTITSYKDDIKRFKELKGITE